MSDPMILPSEMTPAMRHVLGFPNFRCSPIAQLFQQAGYDIPRKAEEEQAFVLHWLLGLVLKHGEEGWSEAAVAKFSELRETIAQRGGGR